MRRSPTAQTAPSPTRHPGAMEHASSPAATARSHKAGVAVLLNPAAPRTRIAHQLENALVGIVGIQADAESLVRSSARVRGDAIRISLETTLDRVEQTQTVDPYWTHWERILLGQIQVLDQEMQAAALQDLMDIRELCTDLDILAARPVQLSLHVRAQYTAVKAGSAPATTNWGGPAIAE